MDIPSTDVRTMDGTMERLDVLKFSFYVTVGTVGRDGR